MSSPISNALCSVTLAYLFFITYCPTLEGHAFQSTSVTIIYLNHKVLSPAIITETVTALHLSAPAPWLMGQAALTVNFCCADFNGMTTHKISVDVANTKTTLPVIQKTATVAHPETKVHIACTGEQAKHRRQVFPRTMFRRRSEVAAGRTFFNNFQGQQFLDI